MLDRGEWRTAVRWKVNSGGRGVGVYACGANAHTTIFEGRIKLQSYVKTLMPY